MQMENIIPDLGDACLVMGMAVASEFILHSDGIMQGLHATVLVIIGVHKVYDIFLKRKAKKQK